MAGWFAVSSGAGLGSRQKFDVDNAVVVDYGDKPLACGLESSRHLKGVDVGILPTSAAIVLPDCGSDRFWEFFVRDWWACKPLQGCQANGVLTKILYRPFRKDVETPLGCQEWVVLLVGAGCLDREDVHVSVVGGSRRQPTLCGPDAIAKPRELNR